MCIKSVVDDRPEPTLTQISETVGFLIDQKCRIKDALIDSGLQERSLGEVINALRNMGEKIQDTVEHELNRAMRSSPAAV